MEIVKIEGLNPLEYEHPLDKKGLDILEKTPGLDFLINKYYELGLEKYLNLSFVGSNLKITSSSLPDIYETLEDACEILNLKKTPEFYVRYDNNTPGNESIPSSNLQGTTVGVERPLIAISNECVDSFSREELLFILGLEIGRIKSQHIFYKDIASLLPTISGIMAGVSFGINITQPVVQGLRFALLQWYRWSEFTADRAGLLACQDLTTTMRAMAKIAGLPSKYFDSFDVDHFITQVREYENFADTSYDKVIKVLSLVSKQQPSIISRANELIKWVDSGEYQAVLERKTKIKTAASASFCSNCGFKLEISNTFCPECGQRVFA